MRSVCAIEKGPVGQLRPTERQAAVGTRGQGGVVTSAEVVALDDVADTEQGAGAAL
jgi:hypothetical protein